MNFKKIFYRGIAKCLAVLLVMNSIALFPNGKEIQAAENGNIILSERLTIMNTGYQLNQGGYVNYHGVYKITSIGSSVTNGEIQIQSGDHEIILDNVSIDLSGEATEEVPVYVRKGCSVIFYLKGNSSLTSKGSMPGIYVENGARAEFRRWDEEDSTQEASITVNAENGAAIGGKASNGTGDITIYSGTFELTSQNGAAIGGGMKATECGDIIINGGHIKASSQNGAGIGGGAEHAYNSDVTVNGGDIEASSGVGAGIGSGANSSFGGNIKIYDGRVKANPNRNIGSGGRGDNENRKKENSGEKRGGDGASGFGGIGAGGSHGGTGGLSQNNMALPESGTDAKKAADMGGNISIFGGYVETASIGAGNAGSGGGGGGSGSNDSGKDLTYGKENGSGGNGGNGGDNKGSILIAGGEIHCKSIGGGNGGNGGGTGGILYEYGNLSGGDGGSAGINYSGAGQAGKNNNTTRRYHPGTGGACGLGGIIKIYGGEIYDVVRIGGTEAEIDRKAGRIYIGNSYQTFDNNVMNPHLDAGKVMVEMRIDEGKASKTAQLSKPFELESFTNQDGTLTLWLSSGNYDFEVAIEENVFFTNGFEVRGDMLNYVAVMPCGGVNLSEVSIVVGNEGYNDGVQEPVPFVSSKDRPYIIYGHTETNGITASEPGIYFMKLQNLWAGSEEVPFLSMKRDSEYYIQAEGFGYLRGIKGFGSIILSENETGYEIRDIDAGISIKDDKGNSRYGTKIQTPWKNQEVIFTYNGSSIKRRTDSEGVLYPLLLQGTNQPATIECPAGRLESELSVAARNWSPVSTVNEYNCRDWNLILDPANGELNILKDTEGYKITSGEMAEFIYTGNNIITIEGNGKKVDAGIHIEGISAKVVCRDINIQTKDSTSPITVGEGSSVEIILSGDNYFSNTSDAAGIRVPKGSMITISGEGKMEVVGGNRAGGIGGSENDESGNVKIKGQAAVDVKGNMGSADGNSSWDIGPACQEVVVENGTLNAGQISGEIKNGSGEELVKKSYGFTQNFRNRELIYSVDHVNYFTTTVGSDNEVYIYSADSSDIKKIWIIQNGYCYMGTADSSRIFTIDFDNSLMPEFDKNMIKGEIIKNEGEELTLGGRAVPSVQQNELRYTWYYKEKAEDSYNILPAEGFVYYISNVTPEDEGYYVLEAEESNGQTIRAEFIVKIGKGSEGGNTSGGNTSGGNTSGENTGGENTSGGNTSGGNTSGGNTSGGNTSGGNTSGGNTSGGNTSGGNTSGGNTSGGNTSGGNTSGGNTNGGHTSGGSTSGGSTGGGSGSSGGGSTGGGSGSTGGTGTGAGGTGSNGGPGSGSAGGTTPSPSGVSASAIVQLDGIVMFDKNNPQLISYWQTSKGIIKSDGNYEFYDHDQWKQEIAVQGKINLKKENGAEIYFISDYSIKVRNIHTKQEYDISIDEIILDPIPPEISLKGESLKINDKAGISYKKTFKNKLTVMVDAEFGFSGKEGLYYKVIKKGKNVNSVKWKKIKNDKITVKKPVRACIYIKGVDKLGNETVVRTQGFRIV